jgi:hypothetical protein
MGDSELSAIATSDLETYYRSIELPFYVAWRAISRKDDPTGCFLVGFLLCLFPVIPFLASTLAGTIYGRPTIDLSGMRFEPSSFWLWWPALATASFLTLLLIGRSQGRLAKYKIQQLSPQQLRFAYCYGALDEIRRYRSNGSPQHMETADAYLGNLMAAMIRASTLDLAEGAYPYHYWQSDAWVGRRRSGEHASVGVRLNLPRWYRLQPETEEIVKAFPRLSRLRKRAVDGRDVEVVESALSDLGTFLYTEIANVPCAAPRATLERIGDASLLSFARKVNALSPYERQPHRPDPHGRLLKMFGAAVRWLTGILTHENVIAVFFAWYFLAFVLEVAAFVIAFRLFPTLSMDTSLIGTGIATPLLVAAAALVLSKLPPDPGN